MLVYTQYFSLSQAKTVGKGFQQPAAFQSCPSSNNTYLIPYLSLTLLLPHFSYCSSLHLYRVGRERLRQIDSKTERETVNIQTCSSIRTAASILSTTHAID